MTKFLLGCMALMVGLAAYAQQNSEGITYGSGRIELYQTDRKADTKFWVASTDAGVYGQFLYEDKQKRGHSDDVRIFINRFLGFVCDSNVAFFFGEGYVNHTPRIILVQVQDGGWFPDLFAVAALHPISGNLIYERWGWFSRGGLSVLCELPNGGGG